MKYSESIAKAIIMFFALRLLIFFITVITGTAPFICYDDLNIYDKIDNLSRYEIFHWLVFRNCYYGLCTLLNKIRIGQYITGARLLNVCLWLATCFKIRKITEYLNFDKKTIQNIFMFVMISPMYAIYSMAVLREVLCTWIVCEAICIFLSYEKTHHINGIRAGLVGIILFFVRTGVLEMLAIVILVHELKGGKRYIKAFLCLLTFAALCYFLTNSDYRYVVSNKINSYVMTKSAYTGLLTRIEVKKISDVYKFIFLIPYVQMIPLPGAYETFYTVKSWSAWITFFSGIQAFFIPYFWYYVLRGKKTNEEKTILFFYFIAVIILAVSQPNNSRFFFFTTPLFYIFGFKTMEILIQKNRINLLPGIVFACIPYLYLFI